ncbi:hypothetical protein UlMin_001009 [Ulmus minor]
MIIKGLFRRYERWNPVHPTSGAFWGMGMGIGCGIGWGPGFGPEVVGYVGAGCGVGFSVGFTLLGIGIGLPTNYLYSVPYNAFMATRAGALDIARSSGILSSKSVARDRWTTIIPDVSGLQKKVSGRLSSFKPKKLLDEGLNSFDVKNQLPAHKKPIWESLRNFSEHLFRHQKGSQD